MALLTALTCRERCELGRKLASGIRQAADEAASLARLPKGIRDSLYGDGVLESTWGMVTDLAGVLAADL